MRASAGRRPSRRPRSSGGSRGALRRRGARHADARSSGSASTSTSRPSPTCPAFAGSFIAAQQRGFSRCSRTCREGRSRPSPRACWTAASRRRSSTSPASVSRAGRPTRRGHDRCRCGRSRPGLVPYRRAIAANVAPLVMLSNASYTAYGGLPAAWSPRVLRLLRGLGFAARRSRMRSTRSPPRGRHGARRSRVPGRARRRRSAALRRLGGLDAAGLRPAARRGALGAACRGPPWSEARPDRRVGRDLRGIDLPRC